MISLRTFGSATFILSACLAGASADVVYDEATGGDLSGDQNAPTFINVSDGNNTVVFTTDQKGDDRDLFTFNVPEGSELTGVILDLFDTNTKDDFNLGFIGFSAGAVLGTDPLAPNPTVLLGYGLVNLGDSGSDIFEIMGQGGGSQGYDGPLPAGPYTFWAQETSPSSDDWRVTLVITPTSAPCTGDLNGDGTVGGADLGLFLGSWGDSPCDADVNGDGVCNGADLGVILGAWGDC
ncbi:MAG: hypothetical protein CMJ67_03695 [Planctomycetaceae bacterium]|nr:hypothetical protein [Planctomycetaceae bacterium]